MIDQHWKTGQAMSASSQHWPQRRTEMSAYRLYTVVPELVTFIDNLTNIYVRYNRRRLKGRNGREDTCMALAILFDTLLVVCKVSIIQVSPSSLLIARRPTLMQSKE